MKFLRFCNELDFDISHNCRHFGKDGIHGWVINEQYVYLGFPNLPRKYGEFLNDEARMLSDDYLINWAANTSMLITDSVCTVFHTDIPSTIENMKYSVNDEEYNSEDSFLTDMHYKPILSLMHNGNSFYITLDGRPVNMKGISDVHIAEKIYDRLADSILRYVKIVSNNTWETNC